ncbi:MAG: DUF4347 domain-containing protein [Leptolyngbyaceae cyanobacterium SM2_3_12]|nr:DUF4347 domain-containing protein [Leptolyngbyaceae cyanobacterium SM2_3_12]
MNSPLPLEMGKSCQAGESSTSGWKGFLSRGRAQLYARGRKRAGISLAGIFLISLFTLLLAASFWLRPAVSEVVVVDSAVGGTDQLRQSLAHHQRLIIVEADHRGLATVTQALSKYPKLVSGGSPEWLSGPGRNRWPSGQRGFWRRRWHPGLGRRRWSWAGRFFCVRVVCC